ERKIAATEYDRSQCCRRFVRLHTQSTLESSLQKDPACSPMRTGGFDQGTAFGSSVQCTSSRSLHFTYAQPSACRRVAGGSNQKTTCAHGFPRYCPVDEGDRQGREGTWTRLR